jgi:predicted Zn-dependent protease
MPQPALTQLDDILTRLDRLIAGSPADSTEAAWIEVRRAAGSNGNGSAAAAGGSPAAQRERTLLIRVRQSGRTGLHRTGAGDPSELENALRDALAQARLAAPTPAEPLAGAAEPATRPDGRAPDETAALYDPEIAELAPARARELLDSRAEHGERLHLSWLEGRVAVANSAGLRRAVRVTAVTMTASCGQGPGAGRAAGAARKLQHLGAATLLDRARRRHPPAGATAESLAPGSPATWAAAMAEAAAATPAESPSAAEAGALEAAAIALERPPGPAMVLSEQATAALLDLLNHHALAATAYRDPAGWLHGKLGQPLFAPCLHLRDDATDPATLAFPFDLAGWAKRPVDMIVAGTLVSPAIDPALGRELGRSPTPHALASDESIAANLLALPAAGAGLAEDDLLRQAEGGLWIAALTNLHCFDARNLRFRAIARGVRRIQAGALTAPLPDLLWEDHLPAVLCHIQALGSHPIGIATQDPLFGAIVAPLTLLHSTHPPVAVP